MNPNECNQWETCGANLCPLDPELDSRNWYHDEPVCTSRKHGAGVRWIRKQRSIQRRQTKSYLDKPITHQQLYDASRPKQLSDEQRAALAERLRAARQNHPTG